MSTHDEELTEVISGLVDTMAESDTDTYPQTAEYIIVARRDTHDGSDAVTISASRGLKPVTALGLLDFARHAMANDFWDDDEEDAWMDDDPDGEGNGFL